MLVNETAAQPQSPPLPGITKQQTARYNTWRRSGLRRNARTRRRQNLFSAAPRLAHHWRNVMSQAQRDAWDIYAAAHPITHRNGRTLTLHAWQWFVRRQRHRLALGLPISSTLPPNNPTFNAGQANGVALPAGLLQITFTPPLGWSVNPTRWMLLRIQRPHPRSTIAEPYQSRNVGFVRGGLLPPTFPIAIFANPYPWTPPGQVIIDQQPIRIL